MFHSRRTRLAEIAEREAKGESFWTTKFEETLRAKIAQLIQKLDNNWFEISTEARARILFEEGLFYLSMGNLEPPRDLLNYVLSGPDEMIPTVVEAWFAVASDDRMRSQTGQWDSASQFQAMMNVLLREHRVSFELSGGEMVPLSSLELHAEVVSPTLRLLSSGKGWEPVEKAYREALAELSKGSPANAVTDAGTALQEALVILGCDGNALGPLIKSARQKGIFGAHDDPMLGALVKVADWVSADRSVTGDAHNAAPALTEDAWLIVHVVGAIILRITKQTPRP